MFTVVGFVVPLFWLFLSFILFTAHQSRWTDIYWLIVHITCPVWNLQGSDIGLLLVPFANAALYGLVGFLLIKIKRAVVPPRK